MFEFNSLFFTFVQSIIIKTQAMHSIKNDNRIVLYVSHNYHKGLNQNNKMMDTSSYLLLVTVLVIRQY